MAAKTTRMHRAQAGQWGGVGVQGTENPLDRGPSPGKRGRSTAPYTKGMRSWEET